MRGLTAKQQRVLDVIVDSMREYGKPPTVREIGEQIGVSSSCTVQRHLDALERKGHIRRSRYQYRSIELTDRPVQPFAPAANIPILGRVAAGAPTLAAEDIEGTYPLPVEIVKPGDQVFMLRVQGDSMKDAGILDGDLVAVRKQPTANNGDIVVALLDGEEATVKRFYKEGDHIRLEAANPAYDPIITRDAQLIGKVILNVRQY